MKSINPVNLEVLVTHNAYSTSQVTSILNNIADFFPKWKQESFEKRTELFIQLSELLITKKQVLAQLATLEMGKPIGQSIAEVEKCALLCQYYAKNGPEFLKRKEKIVGEKTTYISYEPIGAVLGVMPWNFPFWQVFRFAVPTIFAGNLAILKHASNVPQCALAMQDMFLEAGFPEHCFTTLLIGHEEVDRVIEHKIVQAVSVTGSNQTGSSVSAKAAANIKKSVLELGGNDAFIVCDDANVELAAKTAVTARFQNNGQSCIAAKRFFVQQNCYDAFMMSFQSLVSELIVGDPMDPETYIGPLAKQQFVQDIAQQVNQSVSLGATITTGGKVIGEHQQFYTPTIIENVKPGMPVFDQEVFGPVAAVIKFETFDQVIKLVNQSVFGLGATIWSQDIQKAQDIAQELEVGTVAINDYVKSDPNFPFGGVKQSGFGRELSQEGIHEFVNIKVTHLN